MKFTINKEVLLESLQKVLGPTTTKQNFPILNSVLITSIDNKIKLVATDLDVTVVSFQEADVAAKGKTAIPMKRFISIVRELPSQNITIELIKNNLLIKCEKIEFKINTLNPEEFPQTEEEREVSLIKINSAILEEAIRLTSFCVGYEDVNYVLNGIFFEVFEEEIRLVSTDGKRLSFTKRKLPPNQPAVKTKLSFILPIKATNELYKLIKEKEGELFLFVKENKIGFDFKDTQFIARPIEGEFPDYSQYIPNENKDKLVINRQNFLLALRRADLLSTQDYQGVKLELKKDSLVVSKATPQLGEVKEVVEVRYAGSILEIGFNPTYLIDVLKNLDDVEVSFEFFGADKPAVLRKEDYIYLVLPMKI
ncbi:MAG: DNA polymerase III subunit beta [Candidatus Omnitrophota bacterium]|nr:DNA polymerase III subunit beta [Candidatus Omnitrophota bacterium]